MRELQHRKNIKVTNFNVKEEHFVVKCIKSRWCSKKWEELQSVPSTYCLGSCTPPS
jgi:hypothetical protein